MTEPKAPPHVGPWQRRLLLAVLPVGIILLVLWIASVILALGTGTETLGVGSKVIGLIGSLVLIGTGYAYRRRLAEGRDDR